MTVRATQGGFTDWQQLRDHLIDAYSETPHPSTEQEIIDAYELHPTQLEKAALNLINAPDIRSRWAVLKKRANDIGAAPANPKRNTGLEREKQIARAEQWIRAAGLHFDDPTEVAAELFGERGLLRAYAQIDYLENQTDDGWYYTEPQGDTALVTHILDVWANHRPTGMQIERDATTRAEAWKAWKQLQTKPIPF